MWAVISETVMLKILTNMHRNKFKSIALGTTTYYHVGLSGACVARRLGAWVAYPPLGSLHPPRCLATTSASSAASPFASSFAFPALVLVLRALTSTMFQREANGTLVPCLLVHCTHAPARKRIDARAILKPIAQRVPFHVYFMDLWLFRGSLGAQRRVPHRRRGWRNHLPRLWARSSCN